MAASTNPGSAAARAQRGREETTQVALETVAEGGPLAGVLEFLCRTMEDESLDRVIACRTKLFWCCVLVFVAAWLRRSVAMHFMGFNFLN